MKTVNLLIIATGDYTDFLPELLRTAHKYFMKDCKVTYCIFTDDYSVHSYIPHEIPVLSYETYHILHEKWPMPTLKRFHYFKKYIKSIPKADYFFYVDADTKIINPVESTILHDRVAVRHCGYLGERGTYETSPLSTSYVGPNEGDIYFGGGFWGFSGTEFIKLIDKAVDMIDTDMRAGIVPVWHDESVLNRYLIDNPPTKILTPSYHYPEYNEHIYSKWEKKGLSFIPVIILLNKDHSKYQK